MATSAGVGDEVEPPVAYHRRAVTAAEAAAQVIARELEVELEVVVVHSVALVEIVAAVAVVDAEAGEDCLARLRAVHLDRLQLPLPLVVAQRRRVVTSEGRSIICAKRGASECFSFA